MLQISARRQRPDHIIVPSMLNSHTVLSEGPRLVGSYHAGGSEGLDGLKLFDEHLLGGHPLGRYRQGYRERDQERCVKVGLEKVNMFSIVAVIESIQVNFFFDM